MISDDNCEVRELGLQRIVDTKACLDTNTDGNVVVRQFQVPKLNFKAKNYTGLVDWDTVTVSDPPPGTSWHA